MNFLHKLSKILIALVPSKQLRRKLRNKLDARYRNITAKVMQKYTEKFLANKIEPFVAKPKQEVGEKTIWQLWWQGVDEKTPKIVQYCLNSVETNKGDHRVIVLDKNNIGDYIDLPDFVYDKIDKGFKMSQFSDLVRLYLLYAYGGVWIDATIFLSESIDKSILEQEFFAFQRSKLAPDDRDVWESYKPDYFSWEKDFPVRLTNSFMVAQKNHKLIGDLLVILLDYWKNEKTAGHYFFFQILFNQMVNMPQWSGLNCEVTNDTDIHRFQLYAHERYDESLWKLITEKTQVHKLTYFSNIADNSLLAHVLKNSGSVYGSE